MSRLGMIQSALVVAGTTLGLVACSGGDEVGNGRGTYLSGIGKTLVNEAKSIGQAKPAPVAPNPEAEARSALALNKGPLIYVSMGGTGYSSVIGMTGENGAMRTYFTPTKQSIILRNGMVAGTRGFGFDVQSADTAQVERLIRARASGSATKTIRILDGLEKERPIPLTCQVVNTGKAVSYAFAGTTWSGTLIAEHCEGQGGLKLDNSYVVSTGGSIVSSRQWVTPQLGYMTVQTVRP